MLEPFADRIMVGFEACREHYRHPEKVIVTGTPVRRDFFHLTKAEAKRRLGVEDGRPLLVSFWGSLGASGMNRQMADFLALEAAKEPFHHIHGAGKDGYPVLLKLLQLLPDSLFRFHKTPSFRQDAKKTRLLRQCLCIDTKVSPFQPEAGPKPVLTPLGTQSNVPATPFWY